jgi:SAM-dependent methyltransferase
VPGAGGVLREQHVTPLASVGVHVDGIELSEAMIERLRAKPGGAGMNVVRGDMAVVELPARYRLVYLVFDSLMIPLTQDEQVQRVADAARHLTGDGVFVVEKVDTEHVDPEGVTVEASATTGSHSGSTRATSGSAERASSSIRSPCATSGRASSN